MTVTDRIAQATRIGSPVGMIPEGYPNMNALCKQAHIRLHDTVQDERVLRNWSVVTDKNLKTCTEFKKFCMLLDVIEHDHRDWTRASILDSAIGNNPRKSLLSMQWPDMNDQLATIGVHGYQKVARKGTKKGFDSFDDILS